MMGRTKFFCSRTPLNSNSTERKVDQIQTVQTEKLTKLWFQTDRQTGGQQTDRQTQTKDRRNKHVGPS